MQRARARGDHEGDDLRRDLLGSGDEVSLVLPVLIIHDDDDAAYSQGLERVVDFRIFLTHRLFLMSDESGLVPLVLRIVQKTRQAVAASLQLAACHRLFSAGRLGYDVPRDMATNKPKRSGMLGEEIDDDAKVWLFGTVRAADR